MTSSRERLEPRPTLVPPRIEDGPDTPRCAGLKREPLNEGTLGNWVMKDKAAGDGVEGLSRDDAAELKRLRAENAELRMERDVLIGHVGTIPGGPGDVW